MSVAGRTSRNDAGPVDLYAEASAAAWQEQAQPSTAPATGLQPSTNSSNVAGPITAPQTQSQPVTRSGPSTATLSAQPAVPAHLGTVLSQQSLPRSTLPYTPFTPPDRLQQQCLHSSLQQNHRSVSGANSGPDVCRPGIGSVRLQSATNYSNQPGSMSGSSAATTRQSDIMPTITAPPSRTAGTDAYLQPSSQHLRVPSQPPSQPSSQGLLPGTSR